MTADRRLRPTERLRQNNEFQRIYREGKSFAGSFLVLFLLMDPSFTRRAGFVASRRVGGAVARNRAKRRMRSLFRNHKHEVPERGVHLVLVARRGAAEAEYADLEQDYSRLLERVSGEWKRVAAEEQGNR